MSLGTERLRGCTRIHLRQSLWFAREMATCNGGRELLPHRRWWSHFKGCGEHLNLCHGILTFWRRNGQSMTRYRSFLHEAPLEATRRARCAQTLSLPNQLRSGTNDERVIRPPKRVKNGVHRQNWMPCEKLPLFDSNTIRRSKLEPLLQMMEELLFY